MGSEISKQLGADDIVTVDLVDGLYWMSRGMTWIRERLTFLALWNKNTLAQGGFCSSS
jgi:hypothetical protein